MRRVLTGSIVVVAVLFAGCRHSAKEEPVDAVVDLGSRSGPTTLAAASEPGTERPISSLVENALGAGGGFVIGIPRKSLADGTAGRNAAVQASDQAKRQPAKAEDVVVGGSGDLNGDGYVTVDEVVAMRQANLSEREIVDRLKLTNQVFELTDFQEDYLRDRRVSEVVIDAIRHTL